MTWRIKQLEEAGWELDWNSKSERATKVYVNPMGKRNRSEQGHRGRTDADLFKPGQRKNGCKREQ